MIRVVALLQSVQEVEGWVKKTQLVFFLNYYMVVGLDQIRIEVKIKLE
jgi:hypothetical protein